MQEQRLKELVEPILTEHDLELDSLDVKPAGKFTLLRITVDGDGPTGRGPLLDDISEASRKISTELDSSPAVGNGTYTLEVTSRGVGKPLTAPKHYRRNSGRLVQLFLASGDVTGRIKEVEQDRVGLEISGDLKWFDLTDINKAVIQVEMNPPQEAHAPITGNNEEE